MKLVTIAVVAALLGGCATSASKPLPLSAYCPKPDPQAVCAGWQPIYTHAADLALMNARTIEEIDAHNRYGAQRGCWEQ